jgi:hypothetical protein
MGEEKQYMLGIGGECPKCQLGKGLRDIAPIELALTGFDNYNLLHCDTCGANFVKRKTALLWEYMPYQAPKISE